MSPRVLFAALLSALCSVSALAFSKPGHMASGSLAYHMMSKPDAAKVAAILENHPFVKTEWAKELKASSPSSVTRAERLFMLAAAWPDEVRSAKWKKKYHKRDWHFVNYEYTAGATAPGPVLGGQLLTKLKANLADASNSALSLEERAIAICWVIHQTGDLHQPLHVVALVSEDFPKGDRGGNLLYVRTKATNKPVYLHGVWDGMGVRKYSDFAGAQDNALTLKKNFPVAGLTELSARDADSFEAIAKQEAFPLAAKFAYLDGHLDGCDEHEAEESAPGEYVVPADYLKNGGAVASRQLALAGNRIARLLKGAVN